MRTNNALVEIEKLQAKLIEVKAHALVSLPPVSILVDYVLEKLEVIQKCLIE